MVEQIGLEPMTSVWFTALSPLPVSVCTPTTRSPVWAELSSQGTPSLTIILSTTAETRGHGSQGSLAE